MQENVELKHKWELLLNEWQSSGMSKRGWCNANNQSIDQFKYWYKKIFTKKTENLCVHQQWAVVDLTNIQNQHVSKNDISNGFTIKINQVSIDVNKGFDAELLAEIVRALS